MKGLIFCFWIAIVTMPASAAKLIVLDPGEGLMVAIKTENHSILIDTGTLPYSSPRRSCIRTFRSNESFS